MTKPDKQVSLPTHSCEWKDAIIDAAITGWTFTTEHETNPRLAIHALLSQAHIEALDPLISQGAVDLIAKTLTRCPDCGTINKSTLETRCG